MAANTNKPPGIGALPSTRMRGAHVYRTVRNKTPITMADSVLAFAVEYPECEKPKFKSLYIAALTIAYLIDQAPGAALVREFSIANNRLRKEVLKQYGESTEDESLSDLL